MSPETHWIFFFALDQTINAFINYSHAPISMNLGTQVVLPKLYIFIRFGTIHSKIEEIS